MLEKVVEYGKNTYGMAAQNKVETGFVFLTGVAVGPLVYKGVKCLFNVAENSFVGKSTKTAFNNMTSKVKKVEAAKGTKDKKEAHTEVDTIVVLDDELAERLIKACGAIEAMQQA